MNAEKWSGVANRANEQQCSLFMNIEWNQSECNSPAHIWLRLGILCAGGVFIPRDNKFSVDHMYGTLIRSKMCSGHTANIQIGLHAKSGRLYEKKKEATVKFRSLLLLLLHYILLIHFNFLGSLLAGGHAYPAQHNITLVSTHRSLFYLFIHFFSADFHFEFSYFVYSVESTIGNLYIMMTVVVRRSKIFHHTRHWIFFLFYFQTLRSAKVNWILHFVRINERNESNRNFVQLSKLNFFFLPIEFSFWIEFNKMFNLMAFPYLSDFFFFAAIENSIHSHLPFVTIQKRKILQFS